MTRQGHRPYKSNHQSLPTKHYDPSFDDENLLFPKNAVNNDYPLPDNPDTMTILSVPNKHTKTSNTISKPIPTDDETIDIIRIPNAHCCQSLFFPPKKR